MNITLYLGHFLKKSSKVRENAAMVTNAGTEQILNAVNNNIIQQVQDYEEELKQANFNQILKSLNCLLHPASILHVSVPHYSGRWTLWGVLAHASTALPWPGLLGFHA